jgi:hypothetical protein
LFLPIIVSGIEPADGISRIKIGIAGCKNKGNKCTNCDFQKNSEKTESINKRLQDHRTLWPQLKVKFLVYTTDAELLEKCLKRVYKEQINPNGHEIIEGISLEKRINI